MEVMTVRSPTQGQTLPPLAWAPLAGAEVVEPATVLECSLMWLEWERVVRETADTVPAELGGDS